MFQIQKYNRMTNRRILFKFFKLDDDLVSIVDYVLVTIHFYLFSFKSQNQKINMNSNNTSTPSYAEDKNHEHKL